MLLMNIYVGTYAQCQVNIKIDEIKTFTLMCWMVLFAMIIK